MFNQGSLWVLTGAPKAIRGRTGLPAICDGREGRVTFLIKLQQAQPHDIVWHVEANGLCDARLWFSWVPSRAVARVNNSFCHGQCHVG